MTTLDEVITAIRAETGASTNMGQGRDALPGLYQLVARIQRTYHKDFDWPNLVHFPEETINANQRYYTFNDDVDFSRIYNTWVLVNDRWEPMHYGIKPEHYNISNPEAGQTETSPTRWMHYGENQFEIWPVPSEATRIKFECVRGLGRLKAGTDTIVLDEDLLVLSAAAEILARAKSPDASIKLSLATAHYNRLKGNLTKKRMFVMGGEPKQPRRGPRAPR